MCNVLTFHVPCLVDMEKMSWRWIAGAGRPRMQPRVTTHQSVTSLKSAKAIRASELKGGIRESGQDFDIELLILYHVQHLRSLLFYHAMCQPHLLKNFLEKFSPMQNFSTFSYILVILMFTILW